MRTCLLCFLLMSVGFISAQDIDSLASKRKSFHKFSKDSLGQSPPGVLRKDTLWSIIKGNDTIWLSNKEDFLQQSTLREGGISVPYEPKSESFLKQYMEIVYNLSASEDSLNTYRMRYWKKPLKIYIDSSVTSGSTKAFKKFAQQLSKEVDSLNITFVTSREQSNYLVYHTNRKYPDEYLDKLTNTKEGYYILWKYGKINQGYLKVDTDHYQNPDLVNRIMLWRFFLSLGYFITQNTLPCDSYLSTCGYLANERPSQADMEILRYHYSYGICKGTRITEFKDQHFRAKEALRKNPMNQHYFIHFNE